MRFYGRQNELAALHRALTIVRTQSSQLISVLGRRRVGKTTLIAKAFENADIPVFSFFVQDWREEVTAKAWLDAENLARLSGISAGRSKQPPEILEKISRFLLAFSFLARYNLCLCNLTFRSCHGFRSFCCKGLA